MTRLRRAALALLATGLSPCGAACTSAKPEAAALVAAVDRFHKAENADKPDREAAIAAVVCADADVCEAKRVCDAAAKSTAAGLRLKVEVQQGLAALEKGTLSKTDDAARALPDKLDEAGRLMGEGHAQMPACDQKILALRGRYDL
jgi:hypothetical protein